MKKEPQKECIKKRCSCHSIPIMADHNEHCFDCINSKPQKEESWEKEFDELRKDCSYSAPEMIEDRYKSFISNLLTSHRQSTIAQCVEVLEGGKRKVERGTDELEQQYWDRGNNQALTTAIEKLNQLNEKV